MSEETIAKRVINRRRGITPQKFIFILVAAYLLLDNGILASIVFGFPIGTLGQLVLIPLMIYFLYKGKLKFNLILILILCWDFYGVIRILFAYEDYGLIALRSSTYITDTNYILLGGLIAQNNLKRSLRNRFSF